MRNKENLTTKAQLKINNLKLDFIIIDYNGYTKKSKFKHNQCDKEFESRLDHFLERQTCLVCSGRKRDIQRFQEKSNQIHNNEYEILEFQNGNLPVRIKHKICEKEFYQRGCNHLRGDRCEFCYGNIKLSKEDIVKRSIEKWNGDYEILSEEVHYDKKAKFRHKICGYEYDQVVSSHLLGMGCPKCAGNAKHTKESVQKKSDKVHNNEYEILTFPKGSKSKIRILHKICKREFEQVVSDHLVGCGCTYCGFSKGEKFIENLLIDRSIEFDKQKTFDGCKFKNKLKFDFFIPNKSTCIEFDGQHHFMSIRYFGGKKAFELQKIKDQIKNEFCKKNNINLVRFKYDDDFQSIKDRLNQIIN